MSVKNKICRHPIPLSVQRLGGGHTRRRPVFATRALRRLLTYLFEATPPETTYN